MAQFMNFKRMEVTGATKDEALAKAPFNVNLPGADCTQALRNYKKKFAGKAFTDADMKQFMLEQLEKKTRNTEGNGCYIVVEPAVADSRQRPYRIEDVKSTKGSRDYKKVFQIIDVDTNEVLKETSVKYVQDKDKEGKLLVNEDGTPKMKWQPETKAQAKEMMRKLYEEEGYQGNAICRVTHQVVSGESVVFKAYYTPSKNAKQGVYIVFGLPKD